MEADKNKPKVGIELDPELEKENLECQDEIEMQHPDFIQINPDDFEAEDNLTQLRKTLRSIEIKTDITYISVLAGSTCISILAVSTCISVLAGSTCIQEGVVRDVL